MKKFTFLLSLVIFAGCGGGGKGPISPPTPPPPGNEPTINLSANSTRVKPSDIVELNLTTSQPPTAVDWKQSPSSPNGEFRILSTYKTQWKAPVVTNETEFTIVAVVYFANYNSVEASVTITVVPVSAPPPSVTPPRVYITYPRSTFNDNIVGPGVKLQVFGRFSAGTYPVTRLEVLVDGRVVVQLDNPSFDFQFDVEEFGAPGSKQLLIRAVDSQGNTGEASVTIENNPTLLEQLAVEFLRQYCTFAGNRLYRYGDFQDGPFARPVRVYLSDNEVISYHNVVQRACNFWQRYTGIRFEVVDDPSNQPLPLPYILIFGKFNDDPGYIASAKRGYDPTGITGKIVAGYITLYKGWLQLSDDLKSLAIAHEFAHILVIPDSDQGHTNNNSFMDWNLGKRYFHPYMQRAVRILYTKNPGDQI